MNIDWLAIFAAAVAGWAFGAIWYGALAGPWMRAAGLGEADMAGPDGRRKAPIVPLAIAFAANFVMALILAGVIAHTAKQGVTIYAGALVAAICWLGFVITTLATNNAFARARPMVTCIDGGHWLGVLLVQGVVLGALL